MPYIVVRKPSGVHEVQFVRTKEDAVLYDVAVRKLWTINDGAEEEAKRLNQERDARFEAMKRSQMNLLDADD